MNSSSDYFTDPCYTATSDSGTDILLNDRKIEFIKNNKTVCQEDCEFSDYNYEIIKANCSCVLKDTSDDNFDMDKIKLYKNFISI